MRVLLSNHFPLEGSGSGIYTQNVARELTRKGHVVLAITPAHQEQTGFPFEVRTILFTPPHGEIAGEGRLPFNFPCFTTHPVSSTTYGDLTANQQQAYIDAFCQATSQAVTNWKPDLIHAQHLWVTGYAAHKTDVPYVATAHGTDLMGMRKYPNWIDTALEGAQHASAVIVISNQVAQDTQTIYDLPKDRLRLIMNGFDESIFRVFPVDRHDLLRVFGIRTDPKFIVSFVGKLTGFKGVDVLLDAAASYEAELGDVVTLIIGDGELKAKLETQAQELGLKGVHFLGHQPQPEIARILNIADASIVPSRVEPFGLVAVEAMACGTPVVATNEGGLPDFIDEHVGTLVAVDDSVALAHAIIGELKSDAKGLKGPKAASYALEGFSWSSQVDKMVEVYEEVLGEG